MEVADPPPVHFDGASEIFCNRALNLGSMQAVGFDLDYTLAEYIPHTFDTLAFNAALTKLVDVQGYPAAVLDFKYDPNAYQRGLVIDKKRGNLLKLDRHKYVKVAYHGTKQMAPAERQRLYASSFETQPTFSPPDYASVDTAFLLVDTSLYMQLVAYHDAHPDELPYSYATLYKHVRRAVDLCHCDGEIKDAVAAQPHKYIRAAPQLGATLSHLRASGKKVFLLTNSLYDYTDLVCNYVLGEGWLDYFDLVICGARKPGFLLDPYLPLFQARPRPLPAELAFSPRPYSPYPPHRPGAPRRIADEHRDRRARRGGGPAPPFEGVPGRQLEPPPSPPLAHIGRVPAVRRRPHVLRHTAIEAHARLAHAAHRPRDCG